jgi:lysophospholipase L1-like esterase
VIVAVPTPWLRPPQYEYSMTFRDLTRQIARAADVPLVDPLGAFLARGDRYRGDLISDIIHPNEYGHEIMAATLAAALGVPGQHVWDRPLFRAIAEGAKIPD